MLARIQQFTTVSLVLLSTCWVFFVGGYEHPLWAIVGVVALVFGHAIFLAVEFALLWAVHGNDPAPKASVQQLFRAWSSEVFTAPRIFCWQQPFRSHIHPDFLPPAPGRRGVVLVHGYLCNRGFWNRWMAKLRTENIPFVAVDLEPVFGTISDYAPIINGAVERLSATTKSAPIVVGHSMGGLAIRAWLTGFQAHQRVHRVITIGSPHRGTWLGRFGTSRNAREMALGTPWQRLLESRELSEHFEHFTCFYSHCDNIVFPASTATLPGADNQHIVGAAHVHLADQPQVFAEVLKWAGPGE